MKNKQIVRIAGILIILGIIMGILSIVPSVESDDFLKEASINKKLNDTDWNVLNILQKEPDISNKELSEKAFMSVDGIGSSLRRMYIYFDIKESNNE